jgi:hypothetical protein
MAKMAMTSKCNTIIEGMLHVFSRLKKSSMIRLPFRFLSSSRKASTFQKGGIYLHTRFTFAFTPHSFRWASFVGKVGI